MPHIRSLRSSLVALLAVAAFGIAVVLPARPIQAQTVDSAVIINIEGYGGTVNFYSTNHQLGICNTVANKNFSVNGSRTCTGEKIGTPDGMSLYLASVPSGYQFNGFRRDYTYVNGAASCATNSCYFNFDGGSTTVTARFSPIPAPTPPAAPAAPALSVGERTKSMISLSWSTGSTPGGFSRYELVRGGQVIYTTSARTYTNTGLGCGQTFSYLVRIFDNQGRHAVSNTVTTSTLACQTASTSTGSSSSSSSSSSSPSRQTATSRSAPAAPQGSAVTPQTSATTTETLPPLNDTLGDLDEDDSDTADSNEDEAKDEEKADKEDKKGLTNLEKIVLGLFGAVILAILIRYIYVKQVTKQTDYWS